MYAPFRVMQNERVDQGLLQIQVRSQVQNRPIQNARISISYTGEPGQTIEELTTDAAGQTPSILLPTPPIEYSMAPSEYQPYSEYTLRITAEGFAAVDITGTELLPEVKALQPVRMEPLEPDETYVDINIPAHTLFAEYPPKIPEDEIKPVDQSGEIVLSRVVIPEYVVVHDGAPPGPAPA